MSAAGSREPDGRSWRALGALDAVRCDVAVCPLWATAAGGLPCRERVSSVVWRGWQDAAQKDTSGKDGAESSGTGRVTALLSINQLMFTLRRGVMYDDNDHAIADVQSVGQVPWALE